MAFPGYGAAPGGVAQDPLYGYFSAVAGQDGQISADELQRCLTQSGISGTYKPFSMETCRLMVSMLDVSFRRGKEAKAFRLLASCMLPTKAERDHSNSMGFNEFKELWQALNGWKSTFMSYDRDRSGTVEGPELQHAFTSMGFNLSPQAMNIIMNRHSFNGRIGFDDFVGCCTKLRALTDQFQRRDTSRTGTASFHYDDFIQVTMSI